MANHLSYSKAVLKETFRLNPVSVGVGRTTNTDLILSGYNVPKGVNIFNLLERKLVFFHNPFSDNYRYTKLYIMSFG